MSGPDMGIKRALVVSLSGITYATRARKTARELARTFDVRYLGLQSSGRGGRVDAEGVFESDGIAVRHVRVRERRTSGALSSKLHNLFIAYLPAFVALFYFGLKTRASVVIISHPVLAPIALAHRLRFGSRIVLDVPERPGTVTAADSLASVVSRIEPWLLRRIANRGGLATVAVPTDVAVVEGWGFAEAISLRNAPLSAWRAAYRDPPSGETLRCILIGSVFEGRAYEIVLHALAICMREGTDVNLSIVGPGTPEYLGKLHALTEELGVASLVEWVSAIEPSSVSATYLGANIGLVLYEPDDPGNDGLSNKILECVATGRPVVAGDLPENRAFVTQNGVGWLTAVTPEAIAATLRTICSRRDELVELSRHCRDIGDAGLTWEADFKRVLAALET